MARPLDTFSEIAAAATPVLTLLKSSEFRRRIFGQDRKRFTSMCEQVDFLVSKFKTRWILEVEHVLCTSSLFASIIFAFIRVRCRCFFYMHDLHPKTASGSKLPVIARLTQDPIGFWDPLGLSADKDEATFKRRRAVEIKHGRIVRVQVVLEQSIRSHCNRASCLICMNEKHNHRCQ